MKQENSSGLKPLGRAVLIRPYEPEVQASIIHIPVTVKERTSMVEQRAIVVEVGPMAWADEGYWRGWGPFRRFVHVPRAKAGDKVVVSKYAGWLAQGPADGEIYRMVNANDIFAGITAERIVVPQVQEAA